MAVTSCNNPEPIYFIKIIQKNLAKENLRDQFGHEIFPGEWYVKGFYFQKSRLKTSILKFCILNYDVYLTPDEIFKPFVEISNYLTMNSDAYLKLMERMLKF